MANDPVKETGPRLHRGIHPWMASLIALGGIIGSGYFLGSGYLVSKFGVGAAVAYGIGGLIIWVVMQSFAELCVNVPRRGSFVSYAREFLSPSWAVATGWSYWFNWVAYVPSEAVAAGLIMNAFFPTVPVVFWAILSLVLITVLNVIAVEGFGLVESLLALVKIAAIIVFAALALMIVTGMLGRDPVGTSILLPPGKGTIDAILPAGIWIIFTTMAMVLVNYQGSEIVGLAAAETRDPERTVPRACRQVTWRIIALFIIPIILLVMILPAGEAGLEGSVFAAALNKYAGALGLPWLRWIAGAFSFVVLTAAFSCANSGMYGTVRSLYALSVEGLAPAWFSRLNPAGVPRNATLFTLLLCWGVLGIWFFYSDSAFYTWLLSVSGFTGGVCWITICASQVAFRRRVRERGYTDHEIRAAAPFSPWLPLAIGVGLQSVGLLLLAFNEELRGSLYLSIPALLIPVMVFRFVQRRGHVPSTPRLATDEKAFDALFPRKS